MNAWQEKQRCPKCNEHLDRIWFTAQMTQEWSWNGEGYNECTAHHSLINDPDQPVVCPFCENIIGTGRNFGF
ncbi:MAG: hypothetical protein U9R17_17125 [Thermodesulfobacteriota bacterium]|nr:hypothetical protein [Thermodesulfobacteriota bacterium]